MRVRSRALLVARPQELGNNNDGHTIGFSKRSLYKG